MDLIQQILLQLEEDSTRCRHEAEELAAKGEYAASTIMHVWADAYMQSTHTIRSLERLFTEQQLKASYDEQLEEPDWVLQ